jgi:integrase
MDDIVVQPEDELQELLTVPAPVIISTSLIAPDQNPAIIYLGSLASKKGQRSQKQVLRVMADWMDGTIETLDWSKLRYQHAAALRAKAIECGYAPASVQKFMAALRGVLKNSWRLGQMTAEEYQRAVDLPPVKGSTLPAGRYIKSKELEALMNACMADLTSAGVRDAAIIGAMYQTLLRREEVVELNLDDYNADAGELIIRGKGEKERNNFLSGGPKDAMGDWLAARGKQDGPLFLAVQKNGEIRPYTRLSDQAVYNMVSKRILQAGLANISPHDFRRTGISDFLDTTDVITASNIAGHENPQTTKRYDRRPDRVKKEASKGVNLPYTSRSPEIQEVPNEQV